MSNIRKLQIITIALFGTALLLSPSPALANGKGRHDSRSRDDSRSRHDSRSYHYARSHRYPSHDYYGRIVFSPPRSFISITIGGGNFFYGSGKFYRRHDRGYVIVPAPIGAVIYTLPSYHRRIVVRGSVFYECDGVTYVRVANGYQVVEPPDVVVEEPLAVTESPDNSRAESFTVNVPNTRGGYTAVLIKRSGTGFVGPQGEFYNEFPSVEQLRAMYVK